MKITILNGYIITVNKGKGFIMKFENIGLFSGNCLLAIIGLPTKLKDIHGKTCHTGDIVLLWSRDEFSDPEFGFPHNHGLTSIVEDKYTTYSTGEIKHEKDGKPFVMGIKNAGIGADSIWAVEIVKKYSDIVPDEKWPNYGFNYRTIPKSVLQKEHTKEHT